MSINLDTFVSNVPTLATPVQNRPPIHDKVCRYVDAYYNHNLFNDCCKIKSCKNGKITLTSANKHMIKYHRYMVDNYTEAPSEEIKSLLLAMTAYEHECKAKPISKPSTLDGSTKINDVIITTVDTVFPEKQDKAEQEAKDKAEQEAKDKAERERLAKEKTEQEARDKTERERLAAEAKEAAELKAKEAKRIYDSRYFTIILKNIYLFFTLLGNMTHIQAGDLLRNGRSVELVMMLLRIVTYMMFSTLLFMLMSICMALPSFILPMLSFMMIVNCVWISMILVCISSIYTIVFSIYVWKMLTSHEHPLL